jgi:short-subunit dehydrogenase
MDPKVVVITGASGGIGAELARQLGRKGHHVVGAARGEEALRTVMRESASDARAVVADVTKRVEVERVRDEAIRTFGKIDVWVNNVGRGITRRVLDLTDDDIDQMVTANLKSALYGMQAVVPHFQERGEGHLINVSSMLGRVPMAPFRSAYSASKAALNTLTSNLRMDLRATHPEVTISLVMPGIVSTDFAKNALGGSPPMPPNVPTQTAEEVAAVILALIDRPVPEVYSTPALAATARKYYEDVAAFEAAMPAFGPPRPPA